LPLAGIDDFSFCLLFVPISRRAKMCSLLPRRGAVMVLTGLIVSLAVAWVWADIAADAPGPFPKAEAWSHAYKPMKYPLDRWDKDGDTNPPEKDYYLFRTPERSLEQVQKIQADMPKGEFTPAPHDWTYLKRTQKLLTEGGNFHLLALGDSILNDTMRSGWLAQLQEAYPKAKIRGTVYVRGGGGCHCFKDENRIGKVVVPLKPDLVYIGGISQGGISGIPDVRNVIHQLRKGLPDVEILLGTGTFNGFDPRKPKELALAGYSGTGPYGKALKQLAAEEHCAYLDMTGPWAEYIRSSKLHPYIFYRDPVHANDFGEQILGKIMMSFFGPDAK
jgi:lysophospholipase L1-like esterase